MKSSRLCHVAFLAAVFFGQGFAAAAPTPPAPTIDFSSAGYGGGGVALPSVAAKISLAPSGADDTEILQQALDAIAALPPSADGFRGALYLRAGTFHVAGSLKIRAPGIVLRGAGTQKTTLLATGNSRRTLIDVRGSTEDRQLGPTIAVTDSAVAGATVLKLADTSAFSVGTRVVISRPSPKEWITALGMDQFTGSFKDARLDWWPGSRDVEWDRTIVAVDAAAHTITLDAPITSSLKAEYGLGTVQTLRWLGRLHHVGIEDLACASEYDATNPADEEHAWIGVSLENVENAWVRDVTVQHFVSAAVFVGSGAKAVTVADVRSEKPIGENAGWRRHAFYTRGQQVLFLRCEANDAREAFLAGLCSAGPNVFLDCTARGALGDSGSFESWASGALFENVAIEGASLVFGNLGQRWQGAGWNAANCVVWNCTAKEIRVESPPGETNFVSGSQAAPLYVTQLKARVQGAEAALAHAGVDAPSARLALAATDEKAPAFTPVRKEPEAKVPPRPLTIRNGRFLLGDSLFFGAASSNAWWKGQTVPFRAGQLGYHPMRWTPGLIGPGMTEDLAQLTAQLAARDARLLHVWPGLWYDRRRDSHTTEMRDTPETWAPFYEMPWARSGQGKAADGLSKYDLEKFNPWYFARLQEFTTQAAERGQVVYHHFYNHHNLIEAAAHWAEFPWRSANCVQDTGFTEPPPYTENGHHIAVVEEFYDVQNPVRRRLHRLFIRQCLDALKGRENVIHTLGFQFAGPLTFQQFFVDTVAEWEKENGVRVHVALNTSKTITDAILQDPKRAEIVDVIDQRYWQYLPDGMLFAPHSDGKFAFREQRAAAFGKDAVPAGTPELVYRQVREYHDLYPQKAVICGHAGQGPLPILMAGGGYALTSDYAAAQPLKIDRDDKALYAFLREKVAQSLTTLQPVDGLASGLFGLQGNSRWLLYSLSGDTIAKPAALLGKTTHGLWFDPRTGQTQDLHWDHDALLRKPTNAAWLLWLSEENG